jgi:hypothetical protein
MRLIAILFAFMLLSGNAWAAGDCQYLTTPLTLVNKETAMFQCDASGKLLIAGVTNGNLNAAIADGADVTQGAIADLAWSGTGSGTMVAIAKKQRADLLQIHTDLTTAIAAVHTTANAATMTAKASGGTVIDAYAINESATDGRLIAIDANSLPADGALTGATVAECQVAPAGIRTDLRTSIGASYSFGIILVLSSGADCYTKETTKITGYINAKVQ